MQMHAVIGAGRALCSLAILPLDFLHYTLWNLYKNCRLAYTMPSAAGLSLPHSPSVRVNQSFLIAAV
jgi:hypothetical protein